MKREMGLFSHRPRFPLRKQPAKGVLRSLKQHWVGHLSGYFQPDSQQEEQVVALANSRRLSWQPPSSSGEGGRGHGGWAWPCRAGRLEAAGGGAAGVAGSAALSLVAFSYLWEGARLA